MTDLSIDARLLAPDNDRHGANLTVVAVAAAILLAGAAALSGTISWQQGLLFLLGGALGLTLYHALFGFTSAWRVFIVARPAARSEDAEMRHVGWIEASLSEPREYALNSPAPIAPGTPMPR